MSNLNDISSEQKKAIAKWAEKGLDLGIIQTKLAEEFNLNITYRDARFLLLDLGITLKSKEQEAEENPEQIGEENANSLTSKVSVSLDSVVQAGALASGKVVFSDGQKATWQLDQLGRLGLNPETANYRPSETDVAEFQQELKNQMSKSSGLI